MSFNVKEAVAAIRANAEKEKQFVSARRKEAVKESRRVAKLLKEKDPSIKRIYGFGSAFTANERFTRYSDIDLAIEGGNIFSLISTVEDSDFKIDLIDITDAGDSFAENIRKHGTLLI